MGLRFRDWEREQMKNWRFRFWSVAYRPIWWLQCHLLERRYYGRHKRQCNLANAFCSEKEKPKEALWKLAKTLLTYAVCEDGTCGDCDFLRQIAWETLRIKSLISDGNEGEHDGD